MSEGVSAGLYNCASWGVGWDSPIVSTGVLGGTA